MVYIIGEIGINHNGNLELARRLIIAAKEAGCDAVKFQKRTVDVCFTREELAKPRESPFGATQGEYKRGIEFDANGYNAIDAYCREVGIIWGASCWDEQAVDFIDNYKPPWFKIASASLTDDNLLRYTRSKGKPIILSTGMSTLAQIDRAVQVLGTASLTLMHTCSTYPSAYEDLNLRCIQTLALRYGIPVGYSGHETGLATTVAAVALGATVIERHITLDRAMWGSDQSASVEPVGMNKLIRDIRLLEIALGDGVKRVMPAEIPIIGKLRRVG